MNINYLWEDDEVAGISRIECDCGDVKVYIDDVLVVYHESTWFCYKCNKEIKFSWVGMTFK